MIGNGLPAYTVPPSAGPAGLPPTSFGTPTATPENIDMTQPVPTANPYGVSAPPPSFGSTAQIFPAQTFPAQAPGGVPQQRGQVGGTVYGTGGYPSIDMTMPVSTDPVENSGSLTGHILAQGWYDAPVEQRRSNLKVVVAMLAVLGLLVTMSLVFVFTAGDAFTDLVKNFAN